MIISVGENEPKLKEKVNDFELRHPQSMRTVI